MKLWTISVVYAPARILRYGLRRYYATTKYPTEHVLVQHHYPVNYWENIREIYLEAESRNLKVISNYKNVGGHSGFNWAISQLPIADEDIIIGYDVDSNPITPNWDEAMVQALLTQPDLVGVHLMTDYTVKNRNWTMLSGSPVLAVPDRTEMWNVTAWKASFIKQHTLLAAYKYYGQVEAPMWDLCKRLNVKMAYLWSFLETHSEERHDEEYKNWKAAHVAGDVRNFDEWIKLGLLS